MVAARDDSFLPVRWSNRTNLPALIQLPAHAKHNRPAAAPVTTTLTFLFETRVVSL